MEIWIVFWLKSEEGLTPIYLLGTLEHKVTYFGLAVDISSLEHMNWTYLKFCKVGQKLLRMYQVDLDIEQRLVNVEQRITLKANSPLPQSKITMVVWLKSRAEATTILKQANKKPSPSTITCAPTSNREFWCSLPIWRLFEPTNVLDFGPNLKKYQKKLISSLSKSNSPVRQFLKKMASRGFDFVNQQINSQQTEEDMEEEEEKEEEKEQTA